MSAQLTRLGALRAEFATHCAKAERKLADQTRAARRASESTGHNTLRLKISSPKTTTTRNHENHHDH